MARGPKGEEEGAEAEEKAPPVLESLKNYKVAGEEEAAGVIMMMASATTPQPHQPPQPPRPQPPRPPPREIPVYLRSRGRPKFVSGVDEATTCRQVLDSVLMSERQAHLREERGEEEEEEFVLVEQWRGVERPLAAGSRILALWDAWGEEQARVRFVIKRVRRGSSRRQRQQQQRAQENPEVRNQSGQSPTSLTSPGFAPTPPIRETRGRHPRHLRRRNSVSSNASNDTFHPKKLLQQQQDLSRSQQDLEKMMQVRSDLFIVQIEAGL